MLTGTMGLLGITGVAGALKSVFDAQHAWNEEILATSRAHDDVSRRLQVQAKLRQPEFEQAMKEQIGPVAERRGFSPLDAQTAAAELISQGFSQAEAFGPALEETLTFAGATAFEGDMRELVRGLATSLSAKGEALTGANLRGLTAPFASLFDPTPVQAKDIPLLSKLTNVQKEFGQTQQDVYSGFALLLKSGFQPPEAETGMRNVMTILKTAGAKGEQRRILEQVGGPELLEGIDLVGESLPQALLTLRSAFARVPEAQRGAAIGKIAGKENLEAFLALMNKAEQFGEMGRLQEDETALQRGAEIFMEHPKTQETRLRTREELVQMEKAKHTREEEQARTAIRIAAQERGEPATLMQLRAEASKKIEATGQMARFVGGEKAGAAATGLLRGLFPYQAGLGRRPEELLAESKKVVPPLALETPAFAREKSAALVTPPAGKGPVGDIQFGRGAAAKPKTPEELALGQQQLELQRLRLEEKAAKEQLAALPAGRAREARKGQVERIHAEVEKKQQQVGVTRLMVGKAKQEEQEAAARARGGIDFSDEQDVTNDLLREMLGEIRGSRSRAVRRNGQLQ